MTTSSISSHIACSLNEEQVRNVIQNVIKEQRMLESHSRKKLEEGREEEESIENDAHYYINKMNQERNYFRSLFAQIGTFSYFYICLEEVFAFYENSQMDLKARIIDLEGECSKKVEGMDLLQQTNETLENHLAQCESQCNRLRTENADIQEKMNQQIKLLRKEKKQLTKTFRIVQQNTAAEKEYVQTLQNEKDDILGQILSEKKIKEEIKEKLEDYKHKYEDVEHQLQQSGSKLHRVEERTQKLEEELEEKEQLIRQLREQLQILQSKKVRDKHEDDERPPQLFFLDELPQQENKKSLLRSTINNKLSDDLEYINLNEDYELLSRHSIDFKQMEPYERVLRDNEEVGKKYHSPQIWKQSEFRSRIKADPPLKIREVEQKEDYAIKSHESKETQSQDRYFEADQRKQRMVEEPIKRESIEEPRRTSAMKIPNLYLAHFILTSQSVKIKMNNDFLLQLDVKPFYREVVDERVPMHEWSLWIEDKLKSMLTTFDINSS